MKKSFAAILILSVLAVTLMSGCSKSSGTALSTAQISDLAVFLNNEANNAFVGRTEYASPKDIDLTMVLYDGLGLFENYDNLSAEEQADIASATGWYIGGMPIFKLEKSRMEKSIKAKIGIELDEVTMNIDEVTDFFYIEKYDAYYTCHGDTEQKPITISGCKTTKDGLYAIDYYTSYYPEDKCTVTLKKTDDGYQFISDVKAA